MKSNQFFALTHTLLTRRGVRQLNISFCVTASTSISTYMAALCLNVTFYVLFALINIGGIFL